MLLQPRQGSLYPTFNQLSRPRSLSVMDTQSLPVCLVLSHQVQIRPNVLTCFFFFFRRCIYPPPPFLSRLPPPKKPPPPPPPPPPQGTSAPSKIASLTLLSVYQIAAFLLAALDSSCGPTLFTVHTMCFFQFLSNNPGVKSRS